MSAPGAVRSLARAGHTVVFDCGGPRLSVSVLAPRIVRVRFAPDGTFAPRRSWAVARPDDDFPPLDVALREEAGRVALPTGLLTVTVERATGRVAFADAAGRPFCVDAADTPSVTPAGVTCAKRVESGEHFFGFGERTGRLDQRGRSFTNWTTDPPYGHGTGTDPLYIAMPVYLALRPGLAYGLFYNNSYRSRFDVANRREDRVIWEADGGELDYYVFYGPTPADVLQALGEVLGRTPLPPRWALGYHQSRWSYMSADDVRALAGEFRARDMPCDVIHFDIDHMRGYRVFTWDPERFPDPPALLAGLRAQGFHTVTIVDPGVKADSDFAVYRDGLEHDRFVHRAGGEVLHGYVWPDDSVFADFTRADVRRWWGDLQKALVDAGVSGIWNDMNEPAVFARPFSSGFSPAGTLDPDAVQGPPDEQTTHAEVHNLFGSGMAQASYEGLLRHMPDERPFVLTRSGFAGLQRWTAAWMGDNHSWWEHLELSVAQLAHMGLSGAPFVGVDIGGFGGNASGELFARWMQLGALYPFCRGHSSMGTRPHEPWTFGARVEAICREYLGLRYRLLPYLYSLFWEASARGAPVWRPLLYHYPDDPATYTLHDEVLLGPFVLAAPVYQPEQEHRHVYLPAGAWTDWWTGATHQGPAHILAHAPLERLPLYVRAGAIIPSGPDLQYADQRPLDPLTLDVYPGAGEFTLYEDDGHTFAYAQGEFCTTHYRVQAADGALVLAIGAREGRYVPAPRQLVVRVHAVDERAGAGHADARYDAAQRVLTLAFDDDGRARTLRFPGN
jgi:alpha-glucosidase